MDLMIAKEAAAKWGVDVRRVQQMCAEGRIPGAIRPGHDWLIPIDAVKPADGRVNNRRQPKKKTDEVR